VDVFLTDLRQARLAVVVEVVEGQKGMAAATAPSDSLRIPVCGLFAQTLTLGWQKPKAGAGETV
jgi:hypothetical protein